jgi:hypothetical protein
LLQIRSGTKVLTPHAPLVNIFNMIDDIEQLNITHIPTDDQIEPTARDFARSLATDYHANAQQGRSTIVLCGEMHDHEPHHLFRMIMLDELLHLLPAKRIRIGFEVEALKEDTELRPFKEAVTCHAETAPGRLAQLYPNWEGYEGGIYLAMNVAQGLLAGAKVTFNDFNRARNGFLCMNTLQSLHESAFYQEIAEAYEIDVILDPLHEPNLPAGKFLRDIHMAWHVDKETMQSRHPVLALQSVGNDHIFDRRDPGRPSLVSMFDTDKYNIVALAMLNETYDAYDYLAAYACAPGGPIKTYPFSIPSSRANWNMLCTQNSVERFQLPKVA